MANNEWLDCIIKAEKTSLIQDGKKKVFYKFNDGREMAEEYSTDTQVLLRRAWKRKNTFQSSDCWDVEVGDPDTKLPNSDSIGIKEDINSPYLIKRITKNNIEWRIRNLPYPLEIYTVTAESDNCNITVRTSNKKYFKKIPVPELNRVNLLPKQDNIEYSHKFNTLIITYKKPSEVIDLEKRVWKELINVQTLENGDLPCKPS